MSTNVLVNSIFSVRLVTKLQLEIFDPSLSFVMILSLKKIF